MKTLEGHKAFPYIAWTVVLMFTFFTYSLISGIKDSTAVLAEHTKETQDAMDIYVQAKKLQNQKAVISTDRQQQ